MAFIEQSHWFLTPVTIICFGLLHKTTGRVSVHFSCLVSLLPALEKDKLSVTFFSFQSKYPLLLPAPPNLLHWSCYESLYSGCVVWVLGPVPGQCWCITAAGPPHPKSQPCPCAAWPQGWTPHHPAHRKGLCHPLPFEIKANKLQSQPFVRSSWPSGYLC